MKYGEQQQFYRATPKPRKPEMLCHCGKVAWYLAGKQGFCGEHRKEAVAAVTQAAKRIV